MRAWRVYEKLRKGEEAPDAFTVHADHIDVSPVGLSFICFAPEGQTVVAVIPYGQFARCEQIDATGAATHVRA